MISVGIAAAVVVFVVVLYAAKRILDGEKRRLRKQTEEVTRVKKNFISHVSHEMKAPLASMQETTQLLLERIPGPLTDKQKRLLELNLQSGRRLGQMIGNLLELSRLEAGIVEYHFQPHDITQLVLNAVEAMPEASEQIRVEALPGPLIIDCDSGLVVELLKKVLENAWALNGPVRVDVQSVNNLPEHMPSRWQKRLQHASRENGFALVRITDSGPAVEDAQKEIIFETFHQPLQPRPNTSLGLGLAIARALVEAHGGAIWVEDNPAGGSVFCVLFPQSGSAASGLRRAS
jgi:two-component system, NtrC family, sensor histidine kinase GlrK